MKILLLATLFILVSCSSFKAERVDSKESDKRAMEISDRWNQVDSERVVKKLVKGINKNISFAKYKSQKRKPKIFIGEIQNLTSEAYFPIRDLNDELLTVFHSSGQYILIDSSSRQAILDEITYQNDGMVEEGQIKQIGKQAGADLIVFGSVYMHHATRKGKTIKQYSVNLRMTDIETGVEVVRVRTKTSKYSEQSKSGW
ncbi:MAG: hypothetical protein DRQ88_11610 [Epsilonproteobacteria bacterium]|nr:MAG: hypothetical protein DRQ89_08035 [Campylobacterota bacterium]RLA64032.1 MAG: hypothetical protein DRQ88_11610 [Campylobacterota bacterium]